MYERLPKRSARVPAGVVLRGRVVYSALVALMISVLSSSLACSFEPLVMLTGHQDDRTLLYRKNSDLDFQYACAT